MSAPHQDPLVSHTGNSEAADLLRRNLTAIADQNPGTAMASRIREVLAGQRDLFDLEADAEFMALTRSGVRRYEEHLASLSPEERERLYAEARQLSEDSEADPNPG